MARHFSGTDEIQLSTASLIAPYGTFAAIVYPSTTVGWLGIIGYRISSGNWAMSMEINPTGKISFTQAGIGNVGATSLPAANEWYLLAANKASGTVNPRVHQYRFSTSTWVHENSVSTHADSASTVGDLISLGHPEGDGFKGEYRLAAFWSQVSLTDAQLEILPGSLMDWYSLKPSAMWLTDQSATTQAVVDITGTGANQSVLTGTAISTIGDASWAQQGQNIILVN